MFEDLHVHTTLSDGKMSYKEVLDVAAKWGTGIVAFADHDLVPPKDRLKELEKQRGHETKWIVGVELSCAPPPELTGKSVGQLHIVGLFVDPTYRPLINWGEEIVEGRKKRMAQVIASLSQSGFDISMEDCLDEVEGEVIQRPHLVAALLKKPKNIKLLERFLGEMKKAAENNPFWAGKYQALIKQVQAEPDNPWRQPVYPLLLTHDAFVQGVYLPKDKVPQMDQAVGLIRGAGGVAILAHWSECRDDFPIELVEKVVQEERIDGAEVVYDLYRIDMGEEKELRAEQGQVEDLIERYRLLKSGGSDAHTRERLIQMTKTPWFAQKTVGMTEKILAVKPDLFNKWSSL